VEIASGILKDHVKAEMHQAVVEVGSDICATVEEAQRDISKLRKVVSDVASGLGLKIGAAGTHLFHIGANNSSPPPPI